MDSPFEIHSAPVLSEKRRIEQSSETSGRPSLSLKDFLMSLEPLAHKSSLTIHIRQAATATDANPHLTLSRQFHNIFTANFKW